MPRNYKKIILKKVFTFQINLLQKTLIYKKNVKINFFNEINVFIFLPSKFV